MKSLIKIFLAAVVLSGPVYVSAKSNNDDKATQKTEDRHLTGFKGVDLSGSFDVYITQGSTESVKVEAPDDIIDHIITEVNGGVLRIHNKNDVNFHWGDWFGGHHNKIAIYVSVIDINSIHVGGSGDIYFKEGISTTSLKVGVTGSGDILGKVTVKNLESSISGSGDMKISGTAETSTVRVSGSGDYMARGLVTVNTIVKVSGSGDADVYVNGSLTASVSGSGDIRYTGDAKSVSTSKSGSGDIERH